MENVQEFNEEILRIERAERAERINREERERLILEIAREERKKAWDAEINLCSLRGLTSGDTDEERRATFDSMLKRVELRTYGEILRRIDDRAQREIDESRESAAEAWIEAGRRVEIERSAAKAEAQIEAAQLEGLKSVAKDAARDIEGTATSFAIRQAALREGARIEAEHKTKFEREIAQRQNEIEKIKQISQNSKESPEQMEAALKKITLLEKEQKEAAIEEAFRAANVTAGAAIAEEREEKRAKQKEDSKNWTDVSEQTRPATNTGGKYKNTRKLRKHKRARTVHRKRKNTRTQ
jgi:hypothetical protein